MAKRTVKGAANQVGAVAASHDNLELVAAQVAKANDTFKAHFADLESQVEELSEALDTEKAAHLADNTKAKEIYDRDVTELRGKLTIALGKLDKINADLR